MPLPDPFASFPRAHAERIEIAAQDLILAHAGLSAWCGGRVFRCADPTLEPDGPWPKIIVTISYEETPLVLNAEGKIVGQLNLVAIFEERRPKVSTAERSVKSLEQAFRTIFCSSGDSRYLKVPRYNNQRLIEHVLSFSRIDYDVITRGQVFPPESFGAGQRADDPVARYATFAEVYDYHVDGLTQDKVAFIPPMGE